MSTNDHDKSTYYYSGNRKISLIRDPELRLVKYKQETPAERSKLSQKASELLPSESTVAHLNRYGAYILRTKKDRSKSPEEITSVLQDLVSSEDNIEYASVAYRQGPRSPDPMFTTKELVARQKEGVTRKEIESILSKYNIRVVREEEWQPGLLRLEAPAADGPNGPVTLGNILQETGKFEYAKASFIRQRHIRNDGANESNYYQDQWHLEITKTFEAWKITKGNPSIKICIADTGVDYAHREFDGKIVNGYDFELDVADGNPKLGRQDDHGTACAGVATASGIQAAGVAPLCSLIPVRTPRLLGDLDEARMFVWAADNGADIISCSWGPADGFGTEDPIPPETHDALIYSVKKGRDGKGCCIFWAAGNGDEDVGLDGYASDENVMAIAASTNPNSEGQEERAPYSDKGKELLVCAPSNGGSKAILTSDRLGSSGYNPRVSQTPDTAGNYTDRFGGTSSATPLVAGIAALMLSVNPSLTMEKVRDILRRTAEKIGDQSTYNEDEITGLTHSELYGYGRVNTLAAVESAQQLEGGSTASTHVKDHIEEDNLDSFRTLDLDSMSRYDESKARIS